MANRLTIRAVREANSESGATPGNHPISLAEYNGGP